MALAMKWDVCGKYYDLYNRECTDGPSSVSLNNSIRLVYNFDTCPDCIMDIKNYIDTLCAVKGGGGEK